MCVCGGVGGEYDYANPLETNLFISLGRIIYNADNQP